MRLLELPYELLELIIQSLDSPSCYNVQFSNKLLHVVARPHLYSDILIYRGKLVSNEDHRSCISFQANNFKQLEKLLDSIRHNPVLLRYIRKIYWFGKEIGDCHDQIALNMIYQVWVQNQNIHFTSFGKLIDYEEELSWRCEFLNNPLECTDDVYRTLKILNVTHQEVIPFLKNTIKQKLRLTTLRIHLYHRRRFQKLDLDLIRIITELDNLKDLTISLGCEDFDNNGSCKCCIELIRDIFVHAKNLESLAIESELAIGCFEFNDFLSTIEITRPKLRQFDLAKGITIKFEFPLHESTKSNHKWRWIIYFQEFFHNMSRLFPNLERFRVDSFIPISDTNPLEQRMVKFFKYECDCQQCFKARRKMARISDFGIKNYCGCNKTLTASCDRCEQASVLSIYQVVLYNLQLHSNLPLEFKMNCKLESINLHEIFNHNLKLNMITSRNRYQKTCGCNQINANEDFLALIGLIEHSLNSIAVNMGECFEHLEMIALNGVVWKVKRDTGIAIYDDYF